MYNLDFLQPKADLKHYINNKIYNKKILILKKPTFNSFSLRFLKCGVASHKTFQGTDLSNIFSYNFLFTIFLIQSIFKEIQTF